MDLTNKTFGQYRIVRLLGRGGMGEVYEAEHRVLERRYALKLLPADFARRAEAIQRFEREAKVMANLEHPHIVRADEFGETDGRCWLRMELVRGIAPGVVTLADFATQRGGKISQSEYAPILRQILEGLACAHDRGVIHRDLKPGNILLEQTAAGRIQVKVSDFGLARVMGEEFIRSRAQMSVTQSLGGIRTPGAQKSTGEEPTVREDEGTSERALLGTWEYMAPEQRRGEAADAASDIYAVGLMSYRLLTGKGLGLDLPSELVAGLAAEWDQFLEKALEQSGIARYANGGEMLAALTPVLETLDLTRGNRGGEAQRAEVGEQKAGKKQKSEIGSEAGVTPSAIGNRKSKMPWLAAMAVVLALLAAGGWYWGKAVPGQKATAKARADARTAGPSYPTMDQAWENTLGMKFVPVAGTKVLFGIWDVRVKDYRVYANANSGVDNSWQSSGFAQDEDHPVVNVSWNDAKAFCAWLTQKERSEGKISASQSYRLPTDAEWSVAAGLNESNSSTPKDKDGNTPGVYPWGTQWPPPNGAGNYAASLGVDNHANTSPVGSFKANSYGLYDMGGNVWQWCEDWYDSSQQSRVLRGASWGIYNPGALLSSFRGSRAPYGRGNGIGFRCVLANDSAPENQAVSNELAPQKTADEKTLPAAVNPAVVEKAPADTQIARQPYPTMDLKQDMPSSGTGTNDWIPLFDGQSAASWIGANSLEFPAKSWKVEEGLLMTIPNGPKENLRTRDLFRDFELEFDWQIGYCGNSGVFYGSEDSSVFREFQLVDDDLADYPKGIGHPPAFPADHTGALWGVIAPSGDNMLLPAGQWNHGRLVVDGTHVEHWVNGHKVIDYQLDSAELEQNVEQSPSRSIQTRLTGESKAQFLKPGDVPIELQFLFGEVAFRNIRIRRLVPASQAQPDASVAAPTVATSELKHDMPSSGASPNIPADQWFVELDDANGFYASPGVPEAAIGALKTLQNKHIELESFVFTPVDGWVILDNEGVVRSDEGLPESNDNNDWQHHLDPHSTCVAFAPNGTWIILLGGNGRWGPGNPAHNEVNQLRGSGHKVRSVSYGMKDGWVVLYDETGISYGGIPDDLAKVLDNAATDNIAIQCVAFTGQDWICLAQDNWWTSNTNLPAAQVFGQNLKSGLHPKWIAFVPH